MPTQPEQPPQAMHLMDYDEAAAALGGGITATWLRRACRERRIPHTRMSDRVIRFTEDDIRAIIAQYRVEPVEAPPVKSSTPAPSRRRRAS